MAILNRLLLVAFIISFFGTSTFAALAHRGSGSKHALHRTYVSWRLGNKKYRSKLLTMPRYRLARSGNQKNLVQTVSLGSAKSPSRVLKSKLSKRTASPGQNLTNLPDMPNDLDLCSYTVNPTTCVSYPSTLSVNDITNLNSTESGLTFAVYLDSTVSDSDVTQLYAVSQQMASNGFKNHMILFIGQYTSTDPNTTGFLGAMAQLGMSIYIESGLQYGPITITSYLQDAQAAPKASGAKIYLGIIDNIFYSAADVTSYISSGAVVSVLGGVFEDSDLISLAQAAKSAGNPVYVTIDDQYQPLAASLQSILAGSAQVSISGNFYDSATMIQAAQTATANGNTLYINVDPSYYSLADRESIRIAGGIFTTYQDVAFDEFFESILTNVAGSNAEPFIVPVQQDPGATGPITVSGVVNSASFADTVAPGSLASAFLQGPTLVNGVIVAQTLPFPTSLADTNGNSVTVYLTDGNKYQNTPVPLSAIAGSQASTASKDTLQINFLVPPDIDISKGTVQMTVQSTGEPMTQSNFNVGAIEPAVYIVNPAENLGAILNATTNQLVDSVNPIKAGGYISIYASGLGAVTPAEPYNKPAPGVAPLPQTPQPFYVFIGGVPVKALYSGLAPGFVGLYQINVQIPPGTPSGLIPLYLSSDSKGTVVSPTVNTYVQ